MNIFSNQPLLNSLIASSDFMNELFTTPLQNILQDAARAFVLESKPGWWGQKTSAREETLYRRELTMRVLSGIGPALVSIAQSRLNPAADPHLAAFTLKNSVGGQESGEIREISILTFNCALMPEFICVRNKIRPASIRFPKVTEAIIKAKTDFICAQEVFQTELASKLADSLEKEGYTSCVFNVGNEGKGLNSGLFLASRYHLENVQFYPHPLKGGHDAYANKGVLLATAKVSEKIIVIANTHFNGGGDDTIPGDVCRGAQGLNLTEKLDAYVLETFAKFNHVDGVFVAGDFNIGPTCPRDPRDQGRLSFAIDSEWRLAKALGDNREKLLKLLSEKKITEFRDHCQEKRASFQNSLPPNTQEGIREFALSGAPLPEDQYEHSLDSFDKAVEGTTFDLEANAQVGWDESSFSSWTVKPERVDFILTRRPLADITKQPKRVSSTLDAMLGSSDHKAVIEKYFF